MGRKDMFEKQEEIKDQDSNLKRQRPQEFDQQLNGKIAKRGKWKFQQPVKILENLVPSPKFCKGCVQTQMLYETVGTQEIWTKQDLKEIQKKIDAMEAIKSLQVENQIQLIQGINNLKQEHNKFEQARQTAQTRFNKARGRFHLICRVRGGNSINYISYPQELQNFKKLTYLQLNIGNESQTHNFSRVFTPNNTQEDVFKEVSSLLQCTLNGEFVSIFCYGQTGSGKTYTLEGQFDEQILPTSGILPRAGQLIFEKIESHYYTQTFAVYASCLELNIDGAYDLIDQKPVKIQWASGKFIIKDLSKLYISCLAQFLNVIQRASQSRRITQTHHNQASSRSHCIYQIFISNNGDQLGQLNIIDLAGSERADKSSYSSKSSEQVQNMRRIQKEANFINVSLSCLKRVISILAQNRHTINQAFPPYRESNLTKVLQESLSNTKSKVVVFINIKDDNLQETKESLKFGADALVV